MASSPTAQAASAKREAQEARVQELEALVEVEALVEEARAGAARGG